MKALVTGGAGFIGSHIVDKLCAAGASVLVLDDLSTGKSSNISNKCEFVQTDICSTQAIKTLKAFAPEVVFHLAAQINVRRSVTEPLFDADKNILGTINILTAALEAKVRKFIFSSTGGAIYGEQDKFPAPEDHNVRPECPYGVSKRCAELYLEYFSRIADTKAISMRFSNVYGPRQNPKGEAGVVAIFTEKLLAGQPLRVNGDGEQTRDFVFVGDVAEACVAVARQEFSNKFEIFNVGTGIESSVNDIVQGMRKVWTAIKGANAGDGIQVDNGAALAGEQRRSVIDPAKLIKSISWKPSVMLNEGLDKTIRSYLS